MGTDALIVKTSEPLKNLKNWQKQTTEEVKEKLDELERLRQKDITWRLENRENFRKFLIILLVLQNIVVFIIFGLGMWFGKIAGLEKVFSTLVGGTLLE